MLGGNLGLLADDAARHPDRYSERERAFIDELQAGQKDIKALTSADAQTLSQMVYNFVAYRPPKPQLPAATTPPYPKKKKPVLMMDEDELQDGRDPQVEMPGGVMTAYWWV